MTQLEDKKRKYGLVQIAVRHNCIGSKLKLTILNSRSIWHKAQNHEKNLNKTVATPNNLSTSLLTCTKIDQSENGSTVKMKCAVTVLKVKVPDVLIKPILGQVVFLIYIVSIALKKAFSAHSYMFLGCLPLAF